MGELGCWRAVATERHQELASASLNMETLPGQFGINPTELPAAAGPTNESVLAQPHPWDALCRATLITEEQLALIKHYDVDNPMQQDQLMEQHGVRYVQLFYNLV